MSFASAGRRSRGFSLIELVIVVVIIGIIAAIAIPRMSRGAAGAADSALTANLAVLRNALDLFQTEHGGRYPQAGGMAAGALTTYSDDATPILYGAKSATKVFGPYLRSVPPLPVGANKGASTIAEGTAVAGTDGWMYDPATGVIKANSSESDTRGTPYWNY